jgi:hypothetical protein
VPYATSIHKEVMTVCVDDERWSDEATRRDLEEVRLLFARYRRAAREVREADEQRIVEADVEHEPERVPAGV